MSVVNTVVTTVKVWLSYLKPRCVYFLLKLTLSSSVTHSLWSWCQSHSVTGTTWCSPPLSLYSSSSSVYFRSCLKLIQSTFLIKMIHQNSTLDPRKWATITVIAAQDGNIIRSKLKMRKDPPLSCSPPPKLPFSPSSSFSSPVRTSHQGFSFEADHLCHPRCQLAQRAPHSFYTCTHTHSGAELECWAPPLRLCSWLIPEQSRTVKDLHKVAKLNHRQPKTPSWGTGKILITITGCFYMKYPQYPSWGQFYATCSV